jgi:hypothetical protein
MTPTCPGCGVEFTPVPPTRVYCRPSCAARHQHQQGQQAPRLPLDLLVTELPSEAETRSARRTRERIGRLYGRPGAR